MENLKKIYEQIEKDYQESREILANINIKLSKLDEEYDQWCKYSSDLAHYKFEAYKLLSNTEKFSLLEKPVKPGK